MVLKRPFFSDPGKATALHSHCSGLGETEFKAVLLGNRALSQYKSFSWNMVLKRPFFGYTGEASACPTYQAELQAFLLGDRTSHQYDNFVGKMVLKMPFISDTGEASAHLFSSEGYRSSHCLSGRQSFKLI